MAHQKNTRRRSILLPTPKTRNDAQSCQNFAHNIQQNTGQLIQSFKSNLQLSNGRSIQKFARNTICINHANTANLYAGFVQTSAYNFDKHGFHVIETVNKQFNPKQVHQLIRHRGNQMNAQATTPIIDNYVNDSKQQTLGCNSDQFAFGYNVGNYGKQFTQCTQNTRFMACNGPQNRHFSPQNRQNPLLQSTIRLSGQDDQIARVLSSPHQHSVNNNYNMNTKISNGNQCRNQDYSCKLSQASIVVGHAKHRSPIVFRHKTQVGIHTKTPVMAFNQQNTPYILQAFERSRLLSFLSVKLVDISTSSELYRVPRSKNHIKQLYRANAKDKTSFYGLIEGNENDVDKITLKSEFTINMIKKRSDRTNKKPLDFREVQHKAELESVIERSQKGWHTGSTSIGIVLKLSQLHISDIKKENNYSYRLMEHKVYVLKTQLDKQKQRR
ncbi:unnamed protein product [Mytilus edulis]|uniref:Uncharacterized protein n=1 Tax=Mytilus edulis TaxID=6550 RepID=A0A8S3VC06_MYTED|nr:unnamed protein product [Mytilus edulis]